VLLLRAYVEQPVSVVNRQIEPFQKLLVAQTLQVAELTSLYVQPEMLEQKVVEVPAGKLAVKVKPLLHLRAGVRS